MGSLSYGPKPTASRLDIDSPDLPREPAYTLAPEQPISGTVTLLRPRITPPIRYRNINLFSISYAFRPRLRDRLTLGRLP